MVIKILKTILPMLILMVAVFGYLVFVELPKMQKQRSSVQQHEKQSTSAPNPKK